MFMCKTTIILFYHKRNLIIVLLIQLLIKFIKHVYNNAMPYSRVGVNYFFSITITITITIIQFF